MNVESVRVLRTLKFGDKVFQGGKVYTKPFSPDILKEIARGSPHIEILESEADVKEEPQESQPIEIPVEVEKPKSTRKLVRRSKE